MFFSSENAAGDACLPRPPGAAPRPAIAAAPAAKIRILFVDDERPMLGLLKIGMRPMAAQWEMEFAGSGEEALPLIQQKPFDVIVTDMRMPGMNGVQLLNQVQRLHPQTIRIILSGFMELSDAIKSIGLTHQCLAKPCTLDHLKQSIQHVTEVKSRVHHEKLCSLAAGLKNLPSLPELCLQITDALKSPNSSTQLIAELASQDPALSAKLLQLANSAYFGVNNPVFSVDEAVTVLGVGIIQALALAVPLFTAFDRKKFPDFPIDQLWHHSAQTGAIGREIFSGQPGLAICAEHLFAAGVLHDVGKLILAEGLPEEYARVFAESRATRTPLFEVEAKHFHTTHAQVGAYLLALWGLPIPLVEAVADHHQPNRCDSPQLGLTGCVHIASVLQHLHVGQADIIPSPVDADYLQKVNLTQPFEAWRAQFTVAAT
jgi:HD-like signal output (HDOD) protein/CheY-like chemotaxis protein